MAPEQARDCGMADCRSDIYSLGCTVFHMLTGKAPFPEGSIPERLYKHAHEEPPDLRQLNPRVSEGVLRRGAAHARQGSERPLPDPRGPAEGPDPPGERHRRPDRARRAGRAGPGRRRAGPSSRKRRPASAERRLAARRAAAAVSAAADAARRSPIDPDAAGDGDALDSSAGRGSGSWAEPRWPSCSPASAVLVAYPLPAPRPSTNPARRGTVAAAAGHRPRGRRTASGRGDPPQDPVGPAKAEWPALYKPSAPLDRGGTAKHFLGPWERSGEPGAGVPVLRVVRVPFRRRVAIASLQAACTAAAGRADSPSLRSTTTARCSRRPSPSRTAAL